MQPPKSQDYQNKNDVPNIYCAVVETRLSLLQHSLTAPQAAALGYAPSFQFINNMKKKQHEVKIIKFNTTVMEALLKLFCRGVN